LTFDAKAVFQKCRDNRDRLDACPRHFFPLPPSTGIQLGVKLECERCGGKLDLVAINYYVRGYEAAGGDGNDIVSGWREPEAAGGNSERRYFGKPDGSVSSDVQADAPGTVPPLDN
jgi:hypothetical protein